MKQLLLISSFFISIIGFAQNNGNITISTTGNSNLKILFDGKKYSLLDRSVTFQNLPAGNHALVIYQLQKKNLGGTEYVEVFNNNVVLNPKKHLEVSVLRFGKVAWDESFIEPDTWNEGNYNPRNNGNNNQGNNNGNNYGNGPVPVSDQQLAQLKKAMVDATYDNQILTTGKVILKNNWFTVAQIKELCQVFTYDDKRLEFAKVAYDYCIEKGLYISVQDVFTFSTYKTQLINYINSK